MGSNEFLLRSGQSQNLGDQLGEGTGNQETSAPECTNSKGSTYLMSSRFCDLFSITKTDQGLHAVCGWLWRTSGNYTLSFSSQGVTSQILSGAPSNRSVVNQQMVGIEWLRD